MAISAEVEGTFRLGDVFSKSFSVFGRQGLTFFLLCIPPAFVLESAGLPGFLLGLAVPAWVPTTGATSVLFDPKVGLFRLLGGLVAVICWAIPNGAIVVGVVQDLRGGTVSFPKAVAVAVRRFWPMIGVASAAALLTGLAFLLLVVPGIIVLCIYYVAAPVCIAEGIGVGGSLSRSSVLTKEHRWQIFGAIALINIVEIIASFVSIIGAILLSGPAGAKTLPMHIVSYALYALFHAFNTVVAGVFYYQLCVTKDGVNPDKIASVFD